MNSYQAEIGDVVQWFAGALKDSKPTAAIVVDHGGPGQIKLSRVPLAGGEFSLIGCVYHVDDPVLAQNPIIRHRSGGWDYKPSDHRYRSEPVAAAVPPTRAAAKPATRPAPVSVDGDSDAAEVRKLIRDGKSVVQIAKALKGRMTKSEIESLIDAELTALES